MAGGRVSLELSPTSASIIESIKFTRRPGSCEHCDRHDSYTIGWTSLDGTRVTHGVYWCPHPLCSDGDSPWRSAGTPYVKLTEWIIPGGGWPPIATAYLLVITGVRDQRVVTEIQARIGICSQWKDPSSGNFAEPDEEPKLFTQRYFAESGPGVYPATIEDAR